MRTDFVVIEPNEGSIISTTHVSSQESRISTSQIEIVLNDDKSSSQDPDTPT